MTSPREPGRHAQPGPHPRAVAPYGTQPHHHRQPPYAQQPAARFPQPMPQQWHERPTYPPQQLPSMHATAGAQQVVVNVGNTGPGRSVTKQRKSTSHGLHLFLTIITGGAWGLLVWLPITLWHKMGPKEKVTTHHYG